jgi:hypothetical protein
MIRALRATKVFALFTALLAAGVLFAGNPAGEKQKGTQQQIDELEAKIKELRTQLDKQSKNLDAKLKSLRATAVDAERRAERALIEARRREEEIKILLDLVKKRGEELAKAQADATKYRNEALTQADIARVATQQAQNLLNRLQEKERQVAPMILKGAKPERDRSANPPPAYVKGKVLKVNPNDARMVVISLGADAGLKQGHTLEVYRLKPQPTYLGRIQIVDAAKGQATGRLMAPAKGKTPKIEVGDEVASSIR